MSNAICPNRVLAEAYRVVLNAPIVDPDNEEAIVNTLQQIEDLMNRLQRAGITWIKADGTHNG